MKLYSYQEKLVNSKSDRILVNWARGVGKDTAVFAYILEHKPKTVSMDRFTYWNMQDHLRDNKPEGSEVVINESYINIKHLKNDTQTIISRDDITDDNKTENYDLIVFRQLWTLEKRIKSKKAIKVITENLHSYTDREKEMYSDYEVIEVDYKDALKENAISIDKVIEFAMEDSDSFYRQFAIKDKPKKVKVNFDQFKEEALQRLQAQFMNTNDSKDTVLTRKNIIEMIKDLKEIN